jgi:uncharacterized surface protein with fasciclin (FAS1) repeats
MSSSRRLVLAVALLLTGPSLALAQGKTVVDVIKGEPQFSTLAAAIEAAGLAAALSGPSEVTVLAPTNDAFAALPAGALDNLLKPENREQLAAVLKHHVIAGRQGRDEIKKRREITPLSGKALAVELKRGNLEVGGARLASRDRGADNGLVHTIDAVLLP